MIRILVNTLTGEQFKNDTDANAALIDSNTANPSPTYNSDIIGNSPPTYKSDATITNM